MGSISIQETTHANQGPNVRTYLSAERSSAFTRRRRMDVDVWCGCYKIRSEQDGAAPAFIVDSRLDKLIFTLP